MRATVQRRPLLVATALLVLLLLLPLALLRPLYRSAVQVTEVISDAVPANSWAGLDIDLVSFSDEGEHPATIDRGPPENRMAADDISDSSEDVWRDRGFDGVP